MNVQILNFASKVWLFIYSFILFLVTAMEVAAAKPPSSSSLHHSTKSPVSVSSPDDSTRFTAKSPVSMWPHDSTKAKSKVPEIVPHDESRKSTAKSLVSVFSPDELTKFTHNYSDYNFLGRTRYSLLYRGKILNGAKLMKSQAVVVKFFIDYSRTAILPVPNNDKLSRFKVRTLDSCTSFFICLYIYILCDTLLPILK